MIKHIELIKNIPKVIIFWAIALCTLIFAQKALASLPSSASYQIQSYSFGSGGTTNSTSTNYKINGISGEVEFGQPTSTNYKANTGLTFLLTANVPAAPTISNESSMDYNKLKITLNTGSNASDYQYAIAVSTNNFTTTNYIQSDGTTGSSPVWQVSGGAGWSTTSLYAIGLSQNTTYYFKVEAKKGNFTQSPFGPVTNTTTAISSFTFSLSSNSIAIGQLPPGTVVTAPTSVTANISTNGIGGGTVSVYDLNSGLLSSSTGSSISSGSNNLSSVASGYGIQGTSTSQTSGGPMEILTPYNVSSNNVGVVSTTKQAIFDSTGAPVTSGTGTFQIMAKSSTSIKPASDYADTLTVIAAGTF